VTDSKRLTLGFWNVDSRNWLSQCCRDHDREPITITKLLAITIASNRRIQKDMAIDHDQEKT